MPVSILAHGRTHTSACVYAHDLSAFVAAFVVALAFFRSRGVPLLLFHLEFVRFIVPQLNWAVPAHFHSERNTWDTCGVCAYKCHLV